MSKNSPFKIYAIIAISSIFVVFLGVNVYENAKEKFLDISNNNKIIISKNIVSTFQTWLGERKTVLQIYSKFIEKSNFIDDDKKLSSVLKSLCSSQDDFDMVQLLKENGDFFVDSRKVNWDDYEDRKQLLWHIETRDTKQPTINFMPVHAILNQQTINICVPNYKDGKFVATICGVVKLKTIFEKINKFKLPPNAYSFIATHSGRIITKLKDNDLKQKIQNQLIEMFLSKDDVTKLNIDQNYISIEEIESLGWFIGAGVNNQKDTKELLYLVTKDSLLLLLAFIALTLLANYLHNSMRSKLQQKSDEYEALLSHKTKMGEVGELISGINHQFIQPVNSLKLINSSLLMLHNEGNLDNKTLKSMLENGEKSITLLSDTIDIFRNFYKTSENIEPFFISQSIENLLKLMHTELSKRNIKVEVSYQEGVEVKSIENIVQQILLILILNARDALVEMYKYEMHKRELYIKTRVINGVCIVSVSEFGVGVRDSLANKIFSQPKTTKEKGNGMGLYFAKKLAMSKLNGNIVLASNSNPTIFELHFDINLKGKND